MQIGVGLFDELHQDFQPLLGRESPVIKRVGPGGFVVISELDGNTVHPSQV